jgi:ATP-dependent RNA helicase RhlE
MGWPQFIKFMYQSKYSGGFKNFHHHSKKPNRTRGAYRDRIDKSFYIKKAQEIVTIEETVTVNSFGDFGFHEQLLANIKTKGYVKPTEIQDKIISHVTNKRDVLGLANTGTGKTGAYILPLLDRIIKNPNEKIIILTPTRELALQIKEELRSFTMDLKVYIALAIGGAYIREQIIKIRRGPHIIIGTPGRIKDLGKRKVIDFKGLNTIVLDEVDRMLDMGFITDVKAIVEQIPSSRQTLFFFGND